MAGKFGKININHNIITYGAIKYSSDLITSTKSINNSLYTVLVVITELEVTISHITF